MVNVVTMRRWVNKDSVVLLRALLALAEQGDISGLALCYRLSEGAEYAEMTGHYQRVPKDGLNAAMRLSWHLTAAQAADMPGAP